MIGVVKDFNYKSLYDKVETTVLQIFPDAAWKVAVKMKTANIGNTINAVSKVWNKFTPEFPIEYKFLDENFEQMYKSEDKLKSLLVDIHRHCHFCWLSWFVWSGSIYCRTQKKRSRYKKSVGRKHTGCCVAFVKRFYQARYDIVT